MQHDCECLVIGSGLAGLVCALRAAEHGRVTVVTKRNAMDCTTRYAQGGIAAAIAAQDSVDAHIRDTLIAGDGLCREDVVRSILTDAPKAIAQLRKWGVVFDCDATGRPLLTREGGHSARRVLFSGDATGKTIETALLDAARHHPNISILEQHIGVNLITSAKLAPKHHTQNRCLGLYALNIPEQRVDTIVANTTVLASGGAGKVYLYTSNPDVASGDGIAMAYRAGCAVANLEFVQFHPTCLYHREAKTFLLSEALRGEGATLHLINGERFMPRYDPRAELATRDIVARAIDSELKRTGDDYVLLDISHKPAAEIRERFPTIYERCLRYGFDITSGPVPVVPAAHYFCGGVLTDEDGRTDLPGLYACGEVACTGLHGANRLASNSLLEAAVMADRVARDLAPHMKQGTESPCAVPEWNAQGTSDLDEEIVIHHNWDEIRRLMWNYVGIMRSTKRLQRAQQRISMLREEIREYYWNFRLTNNVIELRNIALVADLVIQSALSRRESRGLHCMLDYPHHDAIAKDTVLKI